MFSYDVLVNLINNKSARSAWRRGVKEYALEMVDEIAERADYEGRAPENLEELKEWALNGADNWSAYSWGGSSLIYNCDIAERLCCPSELKKCRGGERRPNSQEKWLDTQARALFQAWIMVKTNYRVMQTISETVGAEAV